MFLTNNKRTAYNLTLYSKEVYSNKNIYPIFYYDNWYIHYYNITPYGNRGKILKKKEKLS